MEILALNPITTIRPKTRRRRIIKGKNTTQIRTYINLCNLIKKSEITKKDFLNFWCAKRGLGNSIDSFEPNVKNDNDIAGYVNFITDNKCCQKFLEFLNSEY